jgi:hypothetical protein
MKHNLLLRLRGGREVGGDGWRWMEQVECHSCTSLMNTNITKITELRIKETEEKHSLNPPLPPT